MTAAEMLTLRQAWERLAEIHPRPPAWETWRSWCRPSWGRRQPDIARLMPPRFRQHGRRGVLMRAADVDRLAPALLAPRRA